MEQRLRRSSISDVSHLDVGGDDRFACRRRLNTCRRRGVAMATAVTGGQQRCRPAAAAPHRSPVPTADVVTRPSPQPRRDSLFVVFFFVFVSYRERVIFESHQALVNDSAKKFRRRVREGGGGRSVVGECVFLSSARQVGVALESSRGQEENRMRLSGPQAGDQLISYRAP